MSSFTRNLVFGAVAGAGVAVALYAYFSARKAEEQDKQDTEKKKYSNWMRRLPGRKLISEVNLAGTHDSAAISLLAPHKLDRQSHSITEQLLNGIRILDVRIAIVLENNHFVFYTTHGSTSPLYQSLTSLIDECKEFLHLHKSEFLILNLQVDAGEPTDAAITALVELFNQDELPILKMSPQSGRLPNVAEARGKMILFNRITDDYNLGIPLTQWVQHQNCDYLIANNAARDKYRIYVQDKYTDFKTHNKDVIAKKKLKYYLSALEKFTETYHTSEHGDKDVLINYASVSDKEKVVNMKPMLLNHMGSAPRASRIGWVMLDFPWDTTAKSADGQEVTVVDFIVMSNFKYEGLPAEFSCVR